MQDLMGWSTAAMAEIYTHVRPPRHPRAGGVLARQAFQLAVAALGLHLAERIGDRDLGEVTAAERDAHQHVP